MTEEFSAPWLDAVPVPLLRIARDGRIEAANGQADSLLGGSVTGRNMALMLRQPQVIDAIEATLEDRETRTARWQAGRAGDSHWRATVTAVASGAVMVAFEDLTALERAEAMRRDFVANVSHELRTPLTALSGFIETLRGSARQDAAARERFLAIMAREAERMSRLIEDLLSLGRVEENERIRPGAPVDLGALVGSVALGLAPLARDRDARLETSLPQTPVVVPGDADQLRQVLVNLTENALKYGPRGQTVTLRLTTTEAASLLAGPAAVLDVRDHGPGIDPVHIPRLTERFYRVDSHRSREIGGTGLGLAIVKHIVTRHRGRLKIESTPGTGSIFRVLLPRQ